MARKKAKKKDHKAHSLKEEATDELLALQAIYEDFELHDDGMGFTLRIVPHPGEAQENWVSIKLAFRYQSSYPRTALGIKLEAWSGLRAVDAEALRQLLSKRAAQFAQDNQVCAFELIGDAQHHLEGHNKAPEPAVREDEDGDGISLAENAEAMSLWHEMQQRVAAAGIAGGSPGAGPGSGGLMPMGLAHGADGGMLFGTLDEGDEWQALPHGLMSKPGNPADVVRNSLQLRDPTGQAASASLAPPTSPFAEESAQDTGPGGQPPILATHVVAGRPQQPVGRPGGSGLGAYLDRTESSGSVIGGVMSAVSWIGAVGRAATLVLPRVLRRALAVDDGGSESDGDNGGNSDEDDNMDRDQVKKDLLLGHLLTLATEGDGAGLPRHALPALASSLVAQGLLPRWTAQTMTHHPKLFERAFQRVFAAEVRPSSHPDAVRFLPQVGQLCRGF
eukprot:jgi/Botrbrau1/23298/Bobra.0102s0039.1